MICKHCNKRIWFWQDEGLIFNRYDKTRPHWSAIYDRYHASCFHSKSVDEYAKAIEALDNYKPVYEYFTAEDILQNQQDINRQIKKALKQ